MASKFFITTPIYYSNGIPHIGHAYSSLLADTIARYRKLHGDEIKFSTGVDENSQKVVESAQAQNMETMQYADMMAEKHKAVWDGIGIGYTDFIRTTEPRHHSLVQKVLQKSFEAGDIYEGVYEGLYCVGCEAFKKDSDLLEDGDTLICPDHPNKPLQELKEKNYFFRLSKYQEKLLDFYEKNPDFITPHSRYKEVIEFVKSGLDDFSISRETNKFGIPLPFDAEQVTYVWYDALFNYITVCEEKNASILSDATTSLGEDAMSFIDPPLSEAGESPHSWWPASLHVIGKDIVRFHAVYWPAMLWSAGYEPPKQLLVTGHFTVDGQKMSKTIGNVIDPVEYTKEYSRDMLILYLFSAFPIGEDGDFDRSDAILQYNAKLSNNLGNLMSRSLTLALKIEGGKVGSYEDPEMAGKRDDYLSKYLWYMEVYDMKGALDLSFAYATELNQYIDMMKPWKFDIENQDDRIKLDRTLSTIMIGLAHLGYNLAPFFEDKMKELLDRMGVGKGWEISSGFVVREKGEPLYMRLEVAKK